MEKVPITPNGVSALKAELKNLRDKERPAIISAIASAREMGDLKENAEYHSAREKQGFIEARIKELESVISRADIIDPSQFTGDTVRFGATVDIYDEETEEEVTYMIVGDYEADTDQNRLSLKAPISRALIGKQTGDIVAVRTPRGPKSYEILDVRYGS